MRCARTQRQIKVALQSKAENNESPIIVGLQMEIAGGTDERGSKRDREGERKQCITEFHSNVI